MSLQLPCASPDSKNLAGSSRVSGLKTLNTPKSGSAGDSLKLPEWGYSDKDEFCIIGIGAAAGRPSGRRPFIIIGGVGASAPINNSMDFN